MSKAKFEAAKELIQQKDYAAARAILKTMPDEPRAIEWLARINAIAPKKQIAAPAPRGRTMAVLFVVVIVVAALSGMAGIAYVLNLRNNAAATVSLLPEMFIKYGVTLRYPSKWQLKDNGDYGITLSTGGETPNEALIVYPLRDKSTVGVCEDMAKLAEKGIPDKDGKAIVKPGGKTSSFQSITPDGWTVDGCTYTSENTILSGAYITLSSTDHIGLSGYSNDANTFMAIYNGILQTVKVNGGEFGNWGRMELNRKATATASYCQGYCSTAPKADCLAVCPSAKQ